jgi:GH25 family lysozyme M1 (1,4-beta-N-acetylmuramidase)
MSLRRPLTESLEPRRLLAQLLANGDFAQDATGWTLAGGFRADSFFSTTAGRSNLGYAYLAAADGSLSGSNNLTGSIAQTVAVPTGATTSSLNFYIRRSTTETVIASDYLTMAVLAPDGQTVVLSSTFNAVADTGYVQHGFAPNLAPYAGQQVTLLFAGSTDSTGPTIFRIDDISWDATIAGNVAPPVPIWPGHPNVFGSQVGSNFPTTTRSPGFVWNSVPGATGYGMELQFNNAGQWQTVFNSESAYGVIPETTTQINGALATGGYRWRVRTFNGATSGPYSLWMHTYVAAPTTRAIGIDVSDFQGNPNWTSVKSAGISFVFTKATEGATFTASTFASNMTNARAAGIPIGAYHFARPNTTGTDALDEADFFASKIQGLLIPGNLRPVLDIEDANGLSAAVLSTWCLQFCNRVLSLTGVAPIIYTGQSFASTYLNSSLNRFPLWIARYPGGTVNPQTATPGGTTPWSTWHFWQYTDAGSVSGISGPVDTNVLNGGMTALEAYKIPDRTYRPGQAPSILSGTTYRDNNLNGAFNSGEPVIAGRTVFLDLDDDGVVDTFDRVMTSNSSGLYSTMALPVGGYSLRQVLPPGWTALLLQRQILFSSAQQSITEQYFGSRPTDITPPTVRSTSYLRSTSPNLISITFSKDVGPSVASNDLTVLRVGSTTPLPVTLVGYDTATLTAQFSLAVADLNPGNYTATLAAGSVSDLFDNALATASTLNFRYLPGDVDNDGTVNFADLLVLANNYNAAGVFNFDTGDFNYDGVVNFQDLLILAANYNTTLTAAVGAKRSSRAASRRAVDAIFNG